MKRILVAIALLALSPALAPAAVTVTPDSLGSSNTKIWILITKDTTGGIYPDTLIKWVTLAGVTNPPTARLDSGTTMNIMKDTSVVSGFHNGTNIYFATVYTLRHNTVIVIDTSVVDSAHTKDIVITPTACADTVNYRFAKIRVTVAGADSALQILATQFKFNRSDDWDWFTKIGNHFARDSTAIVATDTLRLYGDAPYDLRDVANSSGQYLSLDACSLYVRIIGYGNDTTGTDSSVTLALYLPAIPAYQAVWVNGNYAFTNNHLEGGATFTNSVYSFTSHPVYIRPFKKIKAQARVFGTDNNRTCDSLYIEIFSWNYGVWGKVATLVTAQIDTARTVPVIYSLWDSVNVATTFLRTWGDSVDVRVRSKDSTGVAGQTIDRRGFEYRLDFEE